MATVLKPIRNDRELATAMQAIDKLIAKGEPSPGPSLDKLEVLGMLVEAYEERSSRHQISDASDPVEAILFHLDRLGMQPNDLEQILNCSRSRVWEILNRKRPLTLPMIRALKNALQIPADRLIREMKATA